MPTSFGARHRADREGVFQALGGRPRRRARHQSAACRLRLRHAAATGLRDAGVSESFAMELIGHDSVSVDRSYVHTSPDAMRNALNSLPTLS